MYPAYLVRTFGGGISIWQPKPVIKHALLTNKEVAALKFKLHFATPELPAKIKRIMPIPECDTCLSPALFRQELDKVLCNECYEIEMNIIRRTEALRAERNAVTSKTDNRITELTNQLIRELPLSDKEYHVKEITSIVAIEEKLKEMQIPERNYELAKLVEMRVQEQRRRFFEVKKETDELKSALVTDQKYLNILIPKLREEERAQFKDYDISYQPIKVTPIATAKQPRQSASDKAMTQAATMMGLTVEQYRKVMADAVKQVMNIECVCSTTPGMCKVHPK